MRSTLMRGLSASTILAVIILFTGVGCGDSATTTGAGAGPATPAGGAAASNVPKAKTGGACSPKVGSKSPDLALDNGKAKIARGKVTIVDIWATWCKPCEKSFPKYQELYTKYGSQLEVIAIAMDDEEAPITPWVQQRSTKFPVAWDSTHAVASCWKPQNMPTAYIIDKNGVVRHIHREWKDDEAKAVEKEIKALF